MRPLFVLALVLIGALGVATFVVAGGPLFLPSERCPIGVSVNGYTQPEGVALGEWLERIRQRRLGREAYVVVAGNTLELDEEALGVEVDVAKTLRDVRNELRGASPWLLFKQIWAGRWGAVDIPLSLRVDESRARTTLEGIAHETAREPVNARLDLRQHRRIDDVPGQRLDVPATLAALRRTDLTDLIVLQARVVELEAAVRSEMLGAVDVSEVLSSYETSFAGKAGPRAVNIARAARYLNETVIGPGETLSFNKVVGQRTLQRGFVDAPVIVEDEMEPGVGGGVCQVATTLHAAAVYGNLEIVRRRSHSRPSGYAPLGLDATVIDGEVDLRIRNPYESPLIVHAFLPTKTSIRIELLGREPPGTVRHAYGVTETHPFTRRVKVRPELGPDAVKRTQKGNPGYDVVSYVSLTRADGSMSRRQYRSTYYPVPEVYLVGSDRARVEGLPPLPEGAVEAPPEEVPPEEAPKETSQAEEVTAASLSGRRRLLDPTPDPYESQGRAVDW